MAIHGYSYNNSRKISRQFHSCPAMYSSSPSWLIRWTYVVGVRIKLSFSSIGCQNNFFISSGPITTLIMSLIKCRKCGEKFPLADFVDEKTREIFIHCAFCTSGFDEGRSSSQRTEEETCKCGSVFKSCSKRLHLKTQKHLNYLNWEFVRALLQEKKVFLRIPH